MMMVLVVVVDEFVIMNYGIFPSFQSVRLSQFVSQTFFIQEACRKNCIFYDILQNSGWVTNMISFPNKIMTIGLVPESLVRKLKP